MDYLDREAGVSGSEGSQDERSSQEGSQVSNLIASQSSVGTEPEDLHWQVDRLLGTPPSRRLCRKEVSIIDLFILFF